jgi:hypothetical protein
MLLCRKGTACRFVLHGAVTDSYRAATRLNRMSATIVPTDATAFSKTWQPHDGQADIAPTTDSPGGDPRALVEAVRPHLAVGKPSAVRQGFLKLADLGRVHELAAKNAWRGRGGASKVHPGQGRASANPHTAWDRDSVQLEAIPSAPLRCACIRASPHGRSTQDSFLNVSWQRTA